MSSVKIFILVSAVGCGFALSDFRSVSSFACNDEGRFPDPEDCSSYFTCVLNSTTPTGFSSIRRSCPRGNAFAAHSDACVSQEKVPDCPVSHRQSREENHRLPKYDRLCTDDGFKCADCKHFIDCKSGEAFLQEQCDDGFTCQITHEKFPKGICYARTSDTTACNCPVRGVFAADPHNTPSGYIECPTNSDDAEVYQCPERETFDEAKSVCIDPMNHADCTAQGKFAVSGDCRKYYHCIHKSDLLFVKLELECENELHQFDAINQECSDPCNWNWATDSFTCTQEGTFPYPGKCSDYWKCKSNSDGGYDSNHMTCAVNNNFRATSAFTGECVSEIEYPCIPESTGATRHYCTKPDRCTS